MHLVCGIWEHKVFGLRLENGKQRRMWEKEFNEKIHPTMGKMAEAGLPFFPSSKFWLVAVYHRYAFHIAKFCATRASKSKNLTVYDMICLT